MNTEYYIGIDVGKTTIIGGLLDTNYRIVNTVTKESGSTADQILKIIESIIQQYTSLYPGMIIGVGIATFGVVDIDNGTVISSGTIEDWNDIELKNRFETMFNIPVTVENDVKAALFGEYIYSGTYFNNSITYFSIGTNIGMASIVNNSCLYGDNKRAGEIAPLCIINNSNRKMNLGEQIGGKGISDQYFLKTKRRLTAKDIFYQYNTNGDVVATEIYNNMIDTVVKLLEIISHIIDPRYIILGGAIGNNNDIFKQIEERYNHTNSSKFSFLKKSRLGNIAGVYGAAVLSKNSVRKSN